MAVEHCTPTLQRRITLCQRVHIEISPCRFAADEFEQAPWIITFRDCSLVDALRLASCGFGRIHG